MAAVARRPPSRSADYVPRRPPFSATAPRGNVLIEEVMPDKSSRAAGQVFEPYRPHKSLHVLGRRLKTKVLVTGLEVTRRPDMPSKSVGGRKLAGGFDSRPPPLRDSCSDQHRCTRRAAHRPGGSGFRGPRNTGDPHQSSRTSQVFGRSPVLRTGQVFPGPSGELDKSPASTRSGYASTARYCEGCPSCDRKRSLKMTRYCSARAHRGLHSCQFRATPDAVGVLR